MVYYISGRDDRLSALVSLLCLSPGLNTNSVYLIRFPECDLAAIYIYRYLRSLYSSLEIEQKSSPFYYELIEEGREDYRIICQRYIWRISQIFSLLMIEMVIISIFESIDTKKNSILSKQLAL